MIFYNAHIFSNKMNINKCISLQYLSPVCSEDNGSEVVLCVSVGGTGGAGDFTGVVDSGVSNAPSESELLQRRQ